MDFIERSKQKKLIRNMSKGANILKYYNRGVMKADREGFYDLQMSDKDWQHMFGVLASFCRKFGKVLDVGCGPYELIAVRNDENTVGTDICKVALKKLKRFGFRGQIVQADCLHLPFRDSSFDCLVSNQMIEHFYTKQEAQNSIQEMQRVSTRLMIVTPNAVYSRKIHDPSHFLFFTTRSLKQLFPSAGIYALNPPHANILDYYLQYKSPKISRLPILGKIIITVCSRLDSSEPFVKLNKFLWPGSHLIAIKTSN